VDGLTDGAAANDFGSRLREGLTDGSNDFGGGRLREDLTDCFTLGGLVTVVGSTVTTVLFGLTERVCVRVDSRVVGAEALIDTSGGGGKLRDALMGASGVKLKDAALLVTGSLTAFTDLLRAAEDNGVTEGVTDCFKLAKGSDPIGL
jgi:hypothetical protein